MIIIVLACCWLAVLLRTWPGWWRWLNAGGAALGRAVAWFCSGGLGWAFARPWFEGWASNDRVAAAWDARRADWRGSSTGLWQAFHADPGWLCPACHHGNHGCVPGRCRCPDWYESASAPVQWEDYRRGLAARLAAQDAVDSAAREHARLAYGTMHRARWDAWQGAGYDRMLALLTERRPARCEVCGNYRALCPRCLYLDTGQPSPVGCSGERWGQ